MCLQSVAPGYRCLDGRDTIFQHNMINRLVELEACQPAPVQLRPGRSVVVAAVAQQEARQLLTRLAQGAHCRLTCTNEITDRFVGLIRNPDRGQFTGAVQLGKIDRIPPIGLLIRSPGFRGINDGATTAHSCPATVSCRWMP